ncbi:MAG: SurA N-terminal domain-containing protein [Bacteroidales bacterium]|nr:SurA N-terminal domain-containing protein [Bacteroidales bacterium]MCF8343720.1 SurA N-terminal domain-containing protein [Bacteroidales bacterium]MCF8350444.1 SurA N-terminal domain-containing protein [Bacteroidales bacterium]MCF8376193.1 SurA N-terminal domain-containing protein [Bacteroidales bacterium]MCF8401141.1 SurA N-terminal domain-containing protein [Bacteroidales bacterium]
MAVIGKIRKHSGLVVIVIGLALAAFVLSDFTKQGGGSQDRNVGVIDGEEITSIDFFTNVERNAEARKRQRNQEQLNAEEMFRVREDTWDRMVYDILMGEEFNDLGLDVTDKELLEIFQGKHTHPAVVRNFTNPETGQFQRENVIYYINNFAQLPPEQKDQWIMFEEEIRRDQQRLKYTALLEKAYHIPSPFAEKFYLEEEREAIIRISGKKYHTISDSLVSFTEAEVKNKYEEIKHRYEQEASVQFDYVTFDVIPSEADYQKAEEKAQRVYERFQTAENISLFVRANSEEPYDSAWYKSGELPVAIDSIMLNSEIGTMVPPYFENEAFRMAKLVDISYRPDSMEASHILIAYSGASQADPNLQRSRQEAEAFADSLAGLLEQNPNRMEELARANSDGPSGRQGGELGWFKDQTMVYPFNEAVINADIGDIDVVETRFGFHVIKTSGKKDHVKKVRVAQIILPVRASETTVSNIRREAKVFAGENDNEEKFEEAINEGGLIKKSSPRVTKMMFSIPGLEDPRRIIQWAFNKSVEPGDVSAVFTFQDKYVVAVLKERRKEGYMPLEELRTSVENMVIKEKKADMILEEMSALEGNIYEIASQLEAEVDTVTVSFASPNIRGIGREPEVVATVFTSGEGVLTPPVEGNLGVYILVIDQFLEASEITNYQPFVKPFMESYQNQIMNNSYYRALEDAADIKDNRIKFY